MSDKAATLDRGDIVVWPELGSYWRENDPRAWGLRKKVVEFDFSKRRVKFDTGRWAKVERFNGKRGGYTEVCPVAGCKHPPRHLGAHVV